jgi:STE24 endopeptidase
VPDDLHLPDLDAAAYFTASELEKARDYERFLRITGLLSLAVLVVVLVAYAQRGERFTRESAAGRIGTGMLLAMLGFAIVWLAQLPFGLATLWWERKHDVAKLGYLEYAVNSWLSLGSIFLFVSLAILIVMGFAGPLRDRWWIAGAPVFVALALLSAWLSPYLIPDLHRPRDASLTAEMKRFARSQGEEEIPVRVQDVKKFTTEPNAAAVGLGSTRRVVLWDTLLDKPFTRREVRVVLAHELGHQWRDHIWKLLGWYALFAVPGTFLIAVATRRRGGMYDPRAVPLALLVLVVLQIAATPAQNAITRHYEAEADWVALQTTRDPSGAVDAFAELAKTSLSDPDPPAWTQFLEGTHPTIMQRIEMAEEWEASHGRGRR